MEALVPGMGWFEFYRCPYGSKTFVQVITLEGLYSRQLMLTTVPA